VPGIERRRYVRGIAGLEITDDGVTFSVEAAVDLDHLGNP
jgi:hypothetical protein